MGTLFVLSFSLQVSAWGSWAKSGGDSDHSGQDSQDHKTYEYPLSKCLLQEGDLGCMTAFQDGYPTDVDGVPGTAGKFVNGAVVKQPSNQAQNDGDYTISVCSQYDVKAPVGCPAGEPDGNSCGVHVHQYNNKDYTSGCYSKTNIGGHFFKTDDLWSEAHVSTGQDVTKGNVNTNGAYVAVKNGFPLAAKNEFLFNRMYEGQTYITHQEDASRVGCCVLTRFPTKKEAEDYAYTVPYVGLTQQAREDATLITSGKPAVNINAGLENVDIHVKYNDYTSDNKNYQGSGPCAGSTQEPANVCGIHIHSGSGCDSDDQGGHYFCKEGVTEGGCTTAGAVPDPWVTTRAPAFQKNAWKENVVIGLNTDSIEGKVFISHNKDGARVFCGVIRRRCNPNKGNGQCGDGYECKKEPRGRKLGGGWPGYDNRKRDAVCCPVGTNCWKAPEDDGRVLAQEPQVLV